MKIAKNKYRLSPYYQWVEVSAYIKKKELDTTSSSVQSLVNDKKHILAFQKQKYFVVNDAIYQFLQQFKNANTLEKVTQLFAKQFQAPIQDLDEELLFFLEEMIERKILVSVDKHEELSTLLKDKSSKSIFQDGERVMDYIVESCISFRRRAQIYTAIHHNTQKKVILKLLVAPFTSKASKKEKYHTAFRQEFELMKQLEQHPNICQLLIFEEKYPLAVLEYINGISIRKYIESPRTLKEKQLVIQQILNSIAHLHKQQIVHGDIHASNFLITPQGQVKLIDFGMSNHIQPNENELIQKGGVHAYIAPEKIKENTFSFINSKADFKSEIYQLGVLMYYIIYEKFPFRGLTWLQLAKSIKEKEVHFRKRTRHFKEAIPKSYIQSMKTCLSKNPVQRNTNLVKIFMNFKNL